MVRHLDKETQSPITESVCLPGAGVKRVAEKVKTIHDRSSASSSSGCTSTAVFCLSVGTNDIQKRRSEELVNNYKDMMDNIRIRGGTAVVHSILPELVPVKNGIHGPLELIPAWKGLQGIAI